MRRASLRRLLGLTCHSGVLTDFKIMMQKSCYYIQQDPGSLCAKSRGAKPGVHAEAILCSSFLLNTGEIHIIPCLEPIFECRIHLCCLLCSWLQPDVTSLYNTGPYEREIKKRKEKATADCHKSPKWQKPDHNETPDCSSWTDWTLLF